MKFFKGLAPLVSFALTQRRLQETRQETEIDFLDHTKMKITLVHLIMIVYNEGGLCIYFQSLLDMVVGLEWVQNYIAYFGGDPTRYCGDTYSDEKTIM